MKILVTAVMAFVGSNLDDIFVLMVLFAQAACPAQKRRIAAGQCLGMGILTLVSLLLSAGAGWLPEDLLRFMGLLPLGMGLYQLLRRDRESKEETIAGIGLWSTALLTMSNGADNLGIYIPLFAGGSWHENLVIVLIFAALTALWCYLGSCLGNLPLLAKVIRKYRNILVPALLILLGVLILVG